jgi:formylglycine-generating enzyme required for sulfatase activity
MKKEFITITAIFLTLLIAENLLANSAPVVSNVTASQRSDESKLVDIYYNLSDADGDTCTVWAFVSDDDGVSWRIPAWAFSGHVGSAVTPGTDKHIIWDAASDIPGRIGDFKVRVYADDGNGTAPKVVVPGGSFPYQNTTNPANWVYVDSFFIDKYEVTNQFYCQFLNAGNDSGWHLGQEIVRSGESGNYIYTVQAGKENYPVRYVTYYDAEAFCVWRSNLEGMTYRLPTEQEWEKAAAWDPVEQHFYLYGFHQGTIDCGWCNYLACGIGTTTEVGHYSGSGGTQNAKSYYGCYDMSGNVREWICNGGTSAYWRGGAFNDNSDVVATTYRPSSPASKNTCVDYLGFRCVMVVDQ